MEDRKSSVYFVTGNSHKFEEVQQLFDKELKMITLKQLDLNPLEIQADTLQEVAKYKLESLKNRISEGSYFIEDAGFFIDSPLNGFPGVYSSYIFKTIGNEGILNLIKPFEESKAHFASVVALFFEPLDKAYFFEGIVNGTVSSEIKGSQGFGFDPIFVPNEIPDKTFAQITRDQKNKISHRGKALKQLIEFIKKRT
ncbi:MAG: RdgB/HAM1 family non-canonical purine NTP pyrophosphatase [Candidatus Lokiarchaeota archaeon]|nr:RdgB/HAM1 family non-canonical purine NTP pyrophosphatase [Candidatus Lokiarchaeota archaeon]MBD3198568.1 RdgB/HAM1 family non-canonical purine NTP pyrophosphatase [Candidatus Lokiarchaeota archaeon]